MSTTQYLNSIQAICVSPSKYRRKQIFTASWVLAVDSDLRLKAVLVLEKYVLIIANPQHILAEALLYFSQ